MNTDGRRNKERKTDEQCIIDGRQNRSAIQIDSEIQMDAGIEMQQRWTVKYGWTTKNECSPDGQYY